MFKGLRRKDKARMRRANIIRADVEAIQSRIDDAPIKPSKERTKAHQDYRILDLLAKEKKLRD